jgi:hypothetical protein
VNVVAFDPWTPGVVIAGGDNSGIYRSTDYAQTWVPTNTAIPDTRLLQVASIAFSPSVPGTIYAGVGAQGDGGLLVSVDDGLTWKLRSSVPGFSGGVNTGVLGLPATHPRSTGTLIQIDGARGLLYVATFDDGVMRSSDDGATWDALGLAGEHLRSLAIDPASPGVLYASTYGDGVWKTTTAFGAGTFTKVAGSPLIVEDLAFIGTDLYAAGPEGLFRSQDGGFTWTPLGVGQLSSGSVPPPGTLPTWFTVTGFVACGKTVLYAGGQFKGTSSVMVSSDAGVSWTSLLSEASMHTTEGGPAGPRWWLADNQLAAFGGSNYLTTQIAFDRGSATDGCSPQRILVAGRAGVRGTTDAGADWYPMVRGLGVTVIRGLAADPHVPGRVYIAPADWGFASSTDGGVSMTRNAPAQVFDAFGVAVDPWTTPSTVYLATGQFSSNTGEIWSNPDPTSGGAWTNEGLGAAGGRRPTALAVNRVAGSPVILAMTQSSGIWRKSAGAWTLVNKLVQSGAQASFSWVPGSSTVYFYDHGSGVWRSNDAGVSWSEIWAQPPLDDVSGYVAADPRDPSRLYVSVGNVGLFRLDGASAGSVGSGTIVPQPVVGFVAPGPIALRSDGAIHAVELTSATGVAAVRVSTDGGKSWSTVSDTAYRATGGFPRTLSVGPEGAVWAGLFSDGIIMRPSPSSDLVVSVTGGGGGSVTSTPAGIVCPPSCSMPVGWGVPVILTATPVAASTFTGWAGAGCSGTGTCSITMTQATSVTATFAPNQRPDALLSLGTGPFAGNGIYNLTGAGQTISLRQTIGTTRTFRVRVQNDGMVSDSFSIVGPGSSAGFQVSYWVGSTDITSRVTSGAYRSVMLTPGGAATITLVVKVPKGTPVGRVKTMLVTGTSVTLATAKDAVLAKITSG